jgi:hypothetical protein
VSWLVATATALAALAGGLAALQRWVVAPLWGRYSSYRREVREARLGLAQLPAVLEQLSRYTLEVQTLAGDVVTWATRVMSELEKAGVLYSDAQQLIAIERAARAAFEDRLTKLEHIHRHDHPHLRQPGE